MVVSMSLAVGVPEGQGEEVGQPTQPLSVPGGPRTLSPGHWGGDSPLPSPWCRGPMSLW